MNYLNLRKKLEVCLWKWKLGGFLHKGDSRIRFFGEKFGKEPELRDRRRTQRSCSKKMITDIFLIEKGLTEHLKKQRVRYLL